MVMNMNMNMNMNVSGYLSSLCLFLLVLTDRGTNGSLDTIVSRQCLPIPARPDATFCSTIGGYDKMTLPNLNDDETETEALVSLASWDAMLRNSSTCNSVAKLFICSIFAPKCIPHWSSDKTVGMMVLPCRSFCEVVEEKCRPHLARLGVAWPHVFRCSRLPKTEPCVRTLRHPLVQSNTKKCGYCSRLSTVSLLTHYCFASVVLKGSLSQDKLIPINGNVNDSLIRGNDMALRLMKKTDDGAFWEIERLCPCNKVQDRKNGPGPNNSPDPVVYFVAADEVRGELSASVIIALHRLSEEQKKQLQDISNGVAVCEHADSTAPTRSRNRNGTRKTSPKTITTTRSQANKGKRAKTTTTTTTATRRNHKRNQPKMASKSGSSSNATSLVGVRRNTVAMKLRRSTKRRKIGMENVDG